LSRDAPGAGRVLLADVAGLDDLSLPPAAGASSARARDGIAPGPQSSSSSGSIDAQARSQAVNTLARADLLIYCDPTGQFSPIAGVSAPSLRVRTKADLAAAPSNPGVIPVCALDGRNLGVLRHRIAAALRGANAGAEAILAPRHRLALSRAADHLAQALATVDGASPELTANLLREALDALGELTGRTSPDDIIGRVFATFCIGK
jgi:tRNA modification GTPase